MFSCVFNNIDTEKKMQLKGIEGNSQDESKKEEGQFDLNPNNPNSNYIVPLKKKIEDKAQTNQKKNKYSLLFDQRHFESFKSFEPSEETKNIHKIQKKINKALDRKVESNICVRYHLDNTKTVIEVKEKKTVKKKQKKPMKKKIEKSERDLLKEDSKEESQNTINPVKEDEKDISDNDIVIVNVSDNDEL